MTARPWPLSYVPMQLLAGRPNVIVDGAPTDGSVLTLTHWPNHRPPTGLGRDLSAQMAFAYLVSGTNLHSPATAASNNHFDQDGLVGLLALTDPENALSRRKLLEDVAAAGDFGTYSDRGSARASMTIAAYADADRSPLTLAKAYPERCAQLYDDLLGRLFELSDHPDRYQKLWRDEDATLAASEELLSSGAVNVTEFPAEDLAVIDVPEGLSLAGGHLFAHDWIPGLHPMAIHNATEHSALLVRQGDVYRFRYRYETWVQYRSRPVRMRRDLAAVAAELTALEAAGAEWSYDGSQALSPGLHLVGSDHSSIDPNTLLSSLRRALSSAPPDWDPYHEH